jgi:hypothetical protein
MDKSLLLFRGGVRSAVKRLADGADHTLYYKARTPDEIAVFLGAQQRITPDAAGDLERQRQRAAFIAASMCTETGEPLLTEDEARQIPATLKPELCEMIVVGSNEVGALGKALPPGASDGSGTS